MCRRGHDSIAMAYGIFSPSFLRRHPPPSPPTPSFPVSAPFISPSQVLDRYFGNVCELDLIFNFHKAYYILDELLIAGEQQETSKKAVLKLITEQDAVCEEGTDKDMQ